MRITCITLLAALAAVFTGCTKSNVDPEAPSGAIQRNAASATGDVVGKITVGYQGWFAAPGDGSPFNGWWHWSQDASQAPSPTNKGLKSWPDMREYTTTFKTNFANLGNGQPATLFSSYTTQTVSTHFLWMQQNGIDVAALQRFNPNGGEGAIRDAITAKVKTAAETYGRKFYIMYDVSGWQSMQTDLKADWLNKMKAYTSSSAYAMQNGKPVVCIWGFGFNDSNHPFTADACLDVINWFKSQGCYVIGGVPTHWRTQDSDSRPNFLTAYSAFNMISPWMVGRIGNVSDVDNLYTSTNVPDQAYCNTKGIDYQPCVLPGDLQERQRAHGDFMWRQFYNLIRGGCQGIYISMFDEYNEGNQIAKTAETAASVPVGSGFLALDEDGTPCSSDYYLRLTGDGGRMLKGQLALTPTRPTQPIVGAGTGTSTVPIGQTITLKGYNNQYVSDGNNLQVMTCNQTTVSSQQQFTIVDGGSGKVALLSQGKYVSSENGTQAMTCNRTAIGSWEQFDWIKNADGTISLRGNNGKYVSNEGGATTGMNCNRDAAQTWESFKVNN
jgi:hypothetical protein